MTDFLLPELPGRIILTSQTILITSICPRPLMRCASSVPLVDCLNRETLDVAQEAVSPACRYLLSSVPGLAGLRRRGTGGADLPEPPSPPFPCPVGASRRG